MGFAFLVFLELRGGLSGLFFAAWIMVATCFKISLWIAIQRRLKGTRRGFRHSALNCCYP